MMTGSAIDETALAMTGTDETDRGMTVIGETAIAATRTTTCSTHGETRDATRVTTIEIGGIATMMTDIAIAHEAVDGLWASLASPSGSAKP